jgi:hypothetical protein
MNADHSPRGREPSLQVGSARSRLAAWSVRAAGVLILVGGLAKVFWGTPVDLPSVVLDAGRRAPEAMFLTVVGVELFVGLLALSSPRLGWSAVLALGGVFLSVLVAGLIRGDASCGCFGGGAEVPTWLMLVIDALLLTTVLLGRPWRTLSDNPARPWLAAVIGAAVIPVLIVVHSGLAPIDGDLDAHDGKVDGSGAPAGIDGRDAEGVENSAPASDGGSAPPDTSAWRLPSVMPRYVRLEPDRWIGRPVQRTALSTWTDVAAFPSDGLIILYLDTCPDCADHLRSLTAQPPELPLVLVQIPSRPTARHPVVVHTLPPGLHVVLPTGPDWMVRTPWELAVSGRTVTDARYLGK